MLLIQIKEIENIFRQESKKERISLNRLRLREHLKNKDKITKKTTKHSKIEPNKRQNMRQGTEQTLAFSKVQSEQF
jgi:hypothetical protein